MEPISEIDVITILNDTLTKLVDPVARDRVLKWAWDKFASQPPPLVGAAPEIVQQSPTRRKMKPPAKAKSSPSIVKDLNLSPERKRSFRDFVQEKEPGTIQEKCTVAIYYLHNELSVNNISVSHIFTCFKNAGWRVTDLYNSLVLTASRKGWINTSDMNNILITTHGENLVEFDLPHPAKGK